MTGASSSQVLWYSTRATGIMALVLLTGAMVLGVLTSVRFGTSRWPRFAFQDLHRRVSLVAMVFVGLHVLTTVTDSFAPIGWVSVFVPFTSSYRRLWLGLGTIAVDLLLAVTISSLLRRRINPRTWRALHWLAYGSWPLAVVHGLGTGTDPRLRLMLVLTMACAAAVLGAVGWRLVSGWPAYARARVAAGTTGALAVVAVVAWTAAGPLRPGWAARAGTPTALLTGSAKSPAAVPALTPTTTTPPRSAAVAGPGTLPAPPYRVPLAGTITQQARPGGTVQVTIQAQTSGTFVATLDVVIIGTPDGSGGVEMQQSRASFGPLAAPRQFTGTIVGLEGSQFVVALSERPGSPLDLRVDVSVTGSRVTGDLASVGAGGTGDGGGGHDH